MAAKYTLSHKARADIKRIFRYGYQQFGEQQALKYKVGLDACLQLLAGNPALGRTCNEIKAGYRRHEHGTHVVFYRQRGEDIFIIRIIDERMDVKRHL